MGKKLPLQSFSDTVMADKTDIYTSYIQGV